LMVELNLPAQHAEHKRSSQIAIGCRKYIDGFATQQFV
jgi:hypothetical protein